MFRSKSAFEKTLDKATSNLLLEPDLDSMLQLCDLVRGGDIKTRDAAELIKKKVIEENNPNQKLLAVEVLDITMKNCGDNFHSEIISEAFMEKIISILKNVKSEQLKNKLLEMVQCWGLAFKNTEHKVAYRLYNVLKAEGYSFPPESSTGMNEFLKSQSAPVWKDGKECNACKVEFGMVTRKHHCRNCGGIFCGNCTTKQAIIPKFGIEKKVRVCDKCYSLLTSKSKSSKIKGETGSSSNAESDLPLEYLQSDLYKESQAPPPKKSAKELQEEEEMQLALALSMDEQTNRAQIEKDKQREKHITPVGSLNKTEDPDLEKYFDRAYWEKKKEKQKEQEIYSEVKQHNVSPLENKVPMVNEVLVTTSDEDKVFIEGVKRNLEQFMNRMKSYEIRGRSIANDHAVQTMFQSINAVFPKVTEIMSGLDDQRTKQEIVQNKLVQIKEARAAVDALRLEHLEKIRMEAEEAKRQRQIQIAYKLQVMRAKKQEYEAQERQRALYELQQQEAMRKFKIEEKRKQHQMYTAGGYATMNYNQDQQQQPQFYNMQGMQEALPNSVTLASAPPHTPQPTPQQSYMNPSIANNKNDIYQTTNYNTGFQPSTFNGYQNTGKVDYNNYQQPIPNESQHQIFNQETMAVQQPQMVGQQNQDQQNAVPNTQAQTSQQQEPQPNDDNSNLLISFD